MYKGQDNPYDKTVVITNRFLVDGDFWEQISRALSLGPESLILREKDLSDAEYRELAKPVMKLCAEQQVACFIHNRIEIARELGCQNIHLSQSEAARICSEKMAEINPLSAFDQISISCHSPEDVRRAEDFGATRIVLGTIFETECKKGLKGRGLEFVREICRNTILPVYAIGGIKMDNLTRVCEAGAAGGCMMSAFMKY